MTYNIKNLNNHKCWCILWQIMEKFGTGNQFKLVLIYENVFVYVFFLWNRFEIDIVKIHCRLRWKNTLVLLGKVLESHFEIQINVHSFNSIAANLGILNYSSLLDTNLVEESLQFDWYLNGGRIASNISRRSLNYSSHSAFSLCNSREISEKKGYIR